MANLKCNGKVEANSLDLNIGVDVGRKDGVVGTPYLAFYTDGSTNYNSRILSTGNSLKITASGGVYVNDKSLLDLTYPVNSIYISVSNASPASLFGGTWEALPDGYALWTTTKTINSESESVDTSTYVYRKIPAGLPNITGQFTAMRGGASGAFTQAGTNSSEFAGGSTNRENITFDANNGATTAGIYGNSTTVQPRAYRVYVWKRIS